MIPPSVSSGLTGSGAHQFLQSRQGGWVEAQVRIASKVKGEFKQWAADIDNRAREEGLSVSGRDREVRGATAERNFTSG